MVQSSGGPPDCPLLSTGPQVAPREGGHVSLPFKAEADLLYSKAIYNIAISLFDDIKGISLYFTIPV